MSGRYTTEFFVDPSIDFPIFEEAFRKRFPDGEVQRLTVLDNGLVAADGTVPIEQKDEVKLFWDEFCAQHNCSPEYKPSRFVGDI